MSAPTRPRVGVRRLRPSPWWAVGVAGVGTVVNLVMRVMVPINPIGLVTAGIDGGLFESLAIELKHHNWLGKFYVYTLAKGPGYPAFIAITHRLHLQLQVGEQVAYLAGCAAIALALWRVTGRGVAAIVVYLVIAFDPVNYASISAQITRENFYTGPALLAIGAFFVAVHGALTRARWWWIWPPAVVGGGACGWFWLTREEGIWIAPALLVLAVALPLAHLYQTRPPDSAHIDWVEIRRTALRFGAAVLVFGVTFYAPIAVVKMKNEHQYGAKLTNDFGQGEFASAFAAWSRVRGVPLRTFVPVDRAQRQAVYPVSPAARQIQLYLEDPKNGWQTWGCKTMGICDDFPGGAAPWAFRAAMFQAGLFNDEVTFQNYNAQLTKEITAACDSGKLTCSRKLPASLQLADRASFNEVRKTAWYWLGQLESTVWADHPYGPDQVNPVSTRERAEIALVVRHSPRTQADAVRAANHYARHHWPQRQLPHLYHVLFPALIWLTVIGIVLGRFRRDGRPRNFALWALGLSLATATAARLVLFGVVETTQYKPGEFRYYMAARGCYLALVAVGAVCAIDRESVARARRFVVSVARRGRRDPA